MRVILNHLTIGLIYRDFWRVWPAIVGTFMPFFYQLINLYGLLPALFFTVIILSVIITVLSYTLHLISLFFIPLTISCLIIIFLILLASLAWLALNIVINRRTNLEIFKLNYSSRTALSLMSLFLCGQVASPLACQRVSFWELHFKPRLAGKLYKYSPQELSLAIERDYLKLQKNFSEGLVTFGITPGSLGWHLKNIEIENFDFQIIKTIINPEHAKVFGLRRDFFLHILILQNQHKI